MYYFISPLCLSLLFFPLFRKNSENQNKLWLIFTEGKGQRKTFGTKESGAKYLSDINHVVVIEVKILESLHSHSWPPEETSWWLWLFLHCLQQVKISTYSLKYLNIYHNCYQPYYKSTSACDPSSPAACPSRHVIFIQCSRIVFFIISWLLSGDH